MGIVPNTIMYNTAMSALGKSGQWEAAEQLFSETAEPDAVTHETLIAAYGMAGQAAKAELAFKTMLEGKHTPRDYAYCGLIAAHRWLLTFNCCFIHTTLTDIQISSALHCVMLWSCHASCCHWTHCKVIVEGYQVQSKRCNLQPLELHCGILCSCTCNTLQAEQH